MLRPALAAVLLSALLITDRLAAQTPSEPTPAPTIDARGLPGARLLGGGGKLPDAVYARFLELAGGADARVVVIPTASARADTEAGRDATRQRWQQDHPGVHFEILHTRDRAEADSETFTAPLRTATAVWLGGGAQERLAAAYVGTRVERELHALLARGGIVGGSSAGTAIQTRTMIQEGMDPPVLATGFDLLPFAISDQHFLARNRLPRLVKALDLAPGHFGVGIDEGTAVLVRGRRIDVLGSSKALFVLPAGAGREQRVVELAAGDRTDLVTWQRCALARTHPVWPPATMSEPEVANGSLVICGGGRLPPTVVARFVELAGGPAAARIVIVPAASPPALRQGPSPIERMLRLTGAEHVRTIQCRHPDEVTADDVAAIENATAIWFGGGRQWRIVDAFAGTEVPAAFHRVLARGGVIGGSSAGATIQGEFLVRGNPLGNTDMWCEGYDRGFGFLPGCAIDQHFVARDRIADLQQLIARIPQVVGLGIDEGTAAIVHGGTLEVLGDSKIAVVDARANDAGPTPTWLEPGQRWHLVRGLRLP